MFLKREESDAIDAQVAGIESRTGVQIVTALVGKSDSYIELPWKAFALGASLAAFVMVAADARYPEWTTTSTALLHGVTILGAAAAFALVAVFVPAFGRLFLRDSRSEAEVRQFAQALFLERECFRTPRRMSVLILISLFERRIEILPDTGLRDRVADTDWRSVVSRMTPRLRASQPLLALQEGLAALDSMLAAKGFQSAGLDEGGLLPDRPIEERGA